MCLYRAYFSQHKAQKECTGLNESMSLYPVSPVNIPDPHITNTRVTRKKHNLPHRTKTLKSPKRTVRMTKCPCNELKGRKSMESSSEASSLKKASVSYPALTESVVQDASIRMMLALEDERGESSKKILNVRMKKLKRLFSSSDTETKSSNPLLNTSARSSIVSIYNPYKEKMLKNDKAKTGVAALLIKTIHSIPLENVKEDNETSTTPTTNNIKEHENQMKVDTGTNKIAMPEVKVKKEHDSSFEENTSTSNNMSDDSSLDSTSYNILSDTKFSTDEELEASNILTKKLTRTNSFPLLRAKSLKIRLQSTDSDTCPLHESSTPPLFKSLSMHQISYDSEFSMNSRIKKNEHVGTMTENDIVPESIADSSELNKNTNNKSLQCQQNIHSSQDSNFPLATSTPEEIRPPFFLETQSKFTIHSTDSEKCDTSKEYTVITILESNENYILNNIEYDASTDLNNTKHSDLLYADDSEVSVSAYSLLQSASDTESRDKKIMFKKIDEEVLNEKLEEENVRGAPNISLSTQSLPSLKQFQVSTVESSAKEDMNSRVTIESKTSSSAESLIQSSSNEIYDVAHQNRQRRMLDLINIIDTKMMVQPEHINHNSGGRFRRKKRDKTYKNFNPQNLRKTLHNQFLRKHIRNYKQAEVMHSSQFPLNESVPASITPDSSSCNSSLENIIIQPHLCRTELYHLSEGFLTKRSTADLKFHEIAARELTVDTPSSDSLKNNSGIIEMKQLKPDDTNISISPTSVDHAVHNSHSICNIEDVSSHNESTNITNTANSCVSYPSPNHRQQDEASLSPSYPLPAVPSMVSKVCQLPTTKAQPTVSLHRRSSDSDLSITPKGEFF